MFSRCYKTPRGLQSLLMPVVMRCQDAATNTDKEYQVALLYDAGSREYVVFCAWGRWGSPLDGQIKGRVADTDAAVDLAEEWINRKAKRGYVSVSGPNLTSSTVRYAQPGATTQPAPVPASVQPYAPGGAPKPTPGIRFNARKWHAFVKQARLKNVRLFQYYHDSAPAEPAVADYERVVQELFLDAVAANAIALPTGVDPNDFDFSFLRRGSGSSLADTLTVVYRKKQETRSFRCMPEAALSRQSNFFSGESRSVLASICSRAIGLMPLT